MTIKTENCHVQELIPLISPEQVKSQLPLTDEAAELVLRTRHEIRDILQGHDTQRLLVIIGPCSIHDPQAAYEYARRLKALADATREQLLLVMRTYFEKPRTTVGWKGLINDPHLDGTCDMVCGLELGREILIRVSQIGLGCAVEMLDPVTPQYLADLVSWAAIGARTIESQTHREMASGLSMPVGFKNGTDGQIETACNAIISASQPHSFLGVNQEGQSSVIKTTGNPDRHLVLRGGNGTNYHPEAIDEAARVMQAQGIVRSVMVDCSHGNSEKDHTRQAPVCRDVVRQFVAGQSAIMGLMVESNLRPGNQEWQEGATLEPGVSITDACIGWEETESLVREIAQTLANRSVAV
jgi:3-deoxy-7-phosphoheptulonate synthase